MVEVNQNVIIHCEVVCLVIKIKALPQNLETASNVAQIAEFL